MWIKIQNGIVVDIVSSKDDLTEKGYIRIPVTHEIQEGDNIEDFDENWNRKEVPPEVPEFIIEYPTWFRNISLINTTLNKDVLKFIPVSFSKGIAPLSIQSIIDTLKNVCGESEFKLFNKVLNQFVGQILNHVIEPLNEFPMKLQSLLVISATSKTNLVFSIDGKSKNLNHWKSRKLCRCIAKVSNIQNELIIFLNNVSIDLVPVLNRYIKIRKQITKTVSCLF